TRRNRQRDSSSASDYLHNNPSLSKLAIGYIRWPIQFSRTAQIAIPRTHLQFELWQFANGCKVITTKTQRRTQRAQKLFGLASLCLLFALGFLCSSLCFCG